MNRDKEGKKIITAKLLIQDSEGRFLVVRNSEKTSPAGKWELPGG